MVRDTLFCMPRFINLCRKEMVENWRSNVLRIVLLYGVMAVILLWNGYFEYRGNYPSYYLERNEDSAWRFALVAFMWFLWGFGCLSASFTMETMKTKTSRLSVLMTPATLFEKFFCRWMLSTVVFLIVFLITFKLADYTRFLIYSLSYPDLKVIAPVKLTHLVGDAKGYYTLCRTSIELIAVVAVYFFFQSCFVLGSSIWPKNSFLKTFAAGSIITISYTIIAYFLSKALWGDTFSHLSGVYMSEESMLNLLIIASTFFALLNWALAYYRFKESEIIQRM